MFIQPKAKPITIEIKHNERSVKHALFILVVHHDSCIGYCKCEQACIMEEAVIKVLPVKLAMGKHQEHYKLGWEEKRKSGNSLIKKDIKHLQLAQR